MSSVPSSSLLCIIYLFCHLSTQPQDHAFIATYQNHEDEDVASGNASASARAEITRGEKVHLELLEEFNSGLLFVSTDKQQCFEKIKESTAREVRYL